MAPVSISTCSSAPPPISGSGRHSSVEVLETNTSGWICIATSSLDKGQRAGAAGRRRSQPPSPLPGTFRTIPAPTRRWSHRAISGSAARSPTIQSGAAPLSGSGTRSGPNLGLSAGVKDSEAIGSRRISINDLDRRPRPLPNADARRAGEADLPAGAFDGDARPGFGDARPVRAARTQHIGEDGDRVVALEGNEGRRFGQPLAQRRPDSCTEWAEALGQVAQERDRRAVFAQERGPSGELRLPGRSTDHDLGETPVAADSLDDRDCRLWLADQKQEGRRASVDEFVARRRGGERAHVELEDGAAAGSERVPQNAGPRGPVDARLGCYGDSTVARAEEEVCVDLPAAGLGRGEARDPFRWLFGERVENR